MALFDSRIFDSRIFNTGTTGSGSVVSVAVSASGGCLLSGNTASIRRATRSSTGGATFSGATSVAQSQGNVSVTRTASGGLNVLGMGASTRTYVAPTLPNPLRIGGTTSTVRFPDNVVHLTRNFKRGHRPRFWTS
jgi:hypothetical protein